jgi:hypothetical protein
MVVLRKVIVVLLICGLFAWLAFFTWVHLSYTSKLPDSPNKTTGQTYRMIVNHGFVRYGTKKDLQVLRFAENWQLFAIVSTAIAAYLNVKYQVFNKKASEGDMRTKSKYS